MPDTNPNTPETGAAVNVIYPDPCPTPMPLQVDGCRDAAAVTLPQVALASLGRIVQLDVLLKSICPGRQVAVSVILTETDANGDEIPRGVKHLLVPPQTGEGCRDLVLKCIQFSLPEALDPSGNTDSICNARTFQAQVIANYTDTDYTPCICITAAP